MRRRALDLLLGAALLALVVPPPAMADPAPPTPAAAPPAASRPDDDRMARRTARRAALLDADLEAVHAGLQLSASQDKMWPPVVAALHDLEEARGVRFRQTLDAAATPIDGLKLQGDHMARMGAAMGRLADATKPLVASLTPDQKGRLPALIQRVRPRKIVARAFDLPQDGGGSSGSGPSGGRPGGAGVATSQGTAARPGMTAPGATRTAPAAGATDQPDDED